MISSMTGFGRGEIKKNGFVVSVEMRSLNHRFLEIEVRLPRSLSAYEPELKDLIGSQLSRGRISATISVKGEQLPTANLAIDKRLAATYLKLLQELKQELNLNGEIHLDQLLNFPDVITVETEEPDENVWGSVKKSVSAAIDDLKEMRLREGVEIRKDLETRIYQLNKIIMNIESHTKNRSVELYRKLRERVQAIVDSEIIDAGRLEAEVAVMAEKADVTEECIRFKSHATLFLELLDKPESEGRKLNFLLQEMHREANTIGAKTSDAESAHRVVEIKEEVEKLREQVQNIA